MGRAVLEARCGLQMGAAEVYLNIAGGYRLTDPAADLAVAAALISAFSGRPVPADAIVFGELSLSGEVRPVAHDALRLREAAKLGFSNGWGPKGLKAVNGLGVTGFPRLGALVDPQLRRQEIGTRHFFPFLPCPSGGGVRSCRGAFFFLQG